MYLRVHDVLYVLYRLHFLRCTIKGPLTDECALTIVAKKSESSEKLKEFNNLHILFHFRYLFIYISQNAKCKSTGPRKLR